MTDLAVSHIHPAVVCLFVCLVGWLASRLVVGCCLFFLRLLVKDFGLRKNTLPLSQRCFAGSAPPHQLTSKER